MIFKEGDKVRILSTTYHYQGFPEGTIRHGNVPSRGSIGTVQGSFMGMYIVDYGQAMLGFKPEALELIEPPVIEMFKPMKLS